MAGNKLLLEGRVSVKAFLLGLSVVLIPLVRTWFGHLDWVFDYLTETPGKIAICVHIAAINGLLLLKYRGPLYKVNNFCFYCLSEENILSKRFISVQLVVSCLCFPSKVERAQQSSELLVSWFNLIKEQRH